MRLPAATACVASVVLAAATACGSGDARHSEPTPAAPTAPVRTVNARDATAVTVAAAGDIACAPTAQAFGDGQGSGTRCRQQATSQAAADAQPDMVLALGDNQYERGSLEDYNASFARSWGRFLNRADLSSNLLWPVPGNHEYGSGNPTYADAPGYWPSFNGGTEEDPAPDGPAGTTGQGWYALDTGSWRIIALNSECDAFAKGCGPESDQYRWLARTLADTTTRCVMAYWHRPLFTTGKHAGDGDVAPLWDLLERSGGALVLSGHNHSYERFARLDVNGKPSPQGMRQFVVGMGGKDFYEFSDRAGPQPESRNNDTAGVLTLTLTPDGYSWRYRPATFPANGEFVDSGADSC